ncbi:MAG: hypothetical protein JST64_15070 [Actinobacteria bacterium]|nr:hypothetical protein [Actinomycetota bacterium]
MIASYELDGQYKSSAGFPTDAHAWRISYVSTGIDEHDLQIVCGMAAAPAKGPAEFASTGDADSRVGRMLAWAHGTSGLQQACLPSLAPDRSLWGKMADGINAVAWGNGPGARNGEPANGALQTALNRGWVVSATDYQPNDTYVVGRIAAADVIDAARATSQLMQRTYGSEVPDAYDTITWGHSQGGHAAIWAGQMMDAYQAAAPNPDAATLHLSGVAALAPASNFIVQPKEQGIEAGNGLADWEMHHSIEVLGLPIPALEVQIGPMLFSYIFGSWTTLSERGEPSAGSATPAFPANAADLDIRAVTTAEGATSVARIASLCVATDAKEVQRLAAPYRDARAHQMMVPEMWNLPTAYTTGEYFKGAVDRTCAELTSSSEKDRGVGAWCTWIRWNLPGPAGVNPFPKVPERDGAPVPMLIGQGMDDQVIHCQPGDSAPEGAVPAAADCMSVALFDSLRSASDGYCPAGASRGHLELALFRKAGAASPAGHLQIPGQISAAGSGKSSADLTFTGSPLDRFMSGAFDRTLAPGCNARVLNP